MTYEKTHDEKERLLNSLVEAEWVFACSSWVKMCVCVTIILNILFLIMKYFTTKKVFSIRADAHKACFSLYLHTPHGPALKLLLNIKGPIFIPFWDLIWGIGPPKIIYQWFKVEKTAAMCISMFSLLLLSGPPDRTGCFLSLIIYEHIHWLADCTLTRDQVYHSLILAHWRV